MTDDLQNLLAGMVKRMKFVEARNPMWNGQDGYQIGWNHDDRYRVKLDGKVILKEIVGFDRAIAWANEHRTARIASALNSDAVLALVAAAYQGAARIVPDEKRFAPTAYEVEINLRPLKADIRALTPTDATAALARMLADARAEGLEMAAKRIEGAQTLPIDIGGSVILDATTVEACATAIRAMKGEQR